MANGTNGELVDKSANTILNISDEFKEKLKKSLEAIKTAYQIYTPNEIFLSFNGGKDCTVLLNLVDTVIKEMENVDIKNQRLICLYIQPDKPFDEIEQFIDLCKIKYKNIEIITPKEVTTTQEALLRVCAENPQLKACLMGCRRTDPYCFELKTFQETSAGWPPLMRINPVLDWTCEDIWNYIRLYNLSYCSLYDIGYTSLGDKTNTVQNPHLRYTNEKGDIFYRPAYELLNDELERAGRIVKKKNDKEKNNNLIDELKN